MPRNSATLSSVWQELIFNEHTMLLVLQFILCRSCSAPTLASVNCLSTQGRDKKLNESLLILMVVDCKCTISHGNIF